MVRTPVGSRLFTHKEKLIYTKDHELICLACRSKAILPTFVGLCFINENNGDPNFSVDDNTFAYVYDKTRETIICRDCISWPLLCAVLVFYVAYCTRY